MSAQMRAKLLAHDLPALAFGEFFLLGSRQKLLSGFLPVGSGFSLLSFCGFMQCINDLFAFFPGLINDFQVRGVSNVSRSTRGVQKEFALVAALAPARRPSLVIIIFARRLFAFLFGLFPTAHGFGGDAIIDCSEGVLAQAFSEVHEHGRMKRSFFAVFFNAQKELQIWIFLDLLHGLFIRSAKPFLDNQVAQGHSHRHGRRTDLPL